MAPPFTFPRRAACRGFTLMEAIMTIAITGIIAGMVAVFIKAPVTGYFDAVRRAALSDIADTAARRMARDLHGALPNSVRNPGGSDQCLEFIPTKGGGRYRAEVDSTVAPGAGGNFLDFTLVDDAFDMLWTNAALPAASQIGSGDVVVVYNDGSSSGDAYSGNNAIKVASVADNGVTKTATITFVDASTGAPFQRKQLPTPSPANRFQVIPAGEHVVTYVCSGGVLYRYARTLSAAYPRPSSCPSPTGAPILADHLTQCSLKYEGASGALANNGIVSMTLTVSQDGEAVSLYHQASINNQP